MSHPVVRITTNPEACITMLLEKLRKSNWSLAECCIYVQHIVKNQMNGGAQNSHVHLSIMLLVNSARISTYTKATQTLLT